MLKGEELYKQGMTANEYIIAVWNRYRNDVQLTTVARDFARLKKKYSNSNSLVNNAENWDFDGLDYATIIRICDYLEYLKRRNIEITNKELAKQFNQNIIDTLILKNPTKIKKMLY